MCAQNRALHSGNDEEQFFKNEMAYDAVMRNLEKPPKTFPTPYGRNTHESIGAALQGYAISWRMLTSHSTRKHYGTLSLIKCPR